MNGLQPTTLVLRTVFISYATVIVLFSNSFQNDNVTDSVVDTRTSTDVHLKSMVGMHGRYKTIDELDKKIQIFDVNSSNNHSRSIKRSMIDRSIGGIWSVETMFITSFS